jgi:hypothetical protein
MKIVCAWCGKTMGEVKSSRHNNEVSHGACPDCVRMVEENWERRRVALLGESIQLQRGGLQTRSEIRQLAR